MPWSRRRRAIVCACALLVAGVVAWYVWPHSPKGITEESIRNMEMKVLGLGSIRFQDGRWDRPTTLGERWDAVKAWCAGQGSFPWPESNPARGLVMEKVAWGKVKGQPMAAVVLQLPGGYMTLRTVVLVREQAGVPVVAALGEPVPTGLDELEGMTFDQGRIVMELGGGGASPRHFTYTWSGHGDTLDLISEEELPPITSSPSPSSSPP